MPVDIELDINHEPFDQSKKGESVGDARIEILDPNHFIGKPKALYSPLVEAEIETLEG